MLRDAHHQGRFWRGFLAGLAFLTVAVPASAQTTYTYQGNNYDQIFGTAFDTSMSVSGSFTLPLELPPNLTLQTVNTPGLDFDLSNGIRNFTPANSVICEFDIATGPNGEIVQWYIFLREPGIAAGNPQATLETERIVTARDGGYIAIAVADVCGSAPGTDSGVVENNPGTWTSDADPAPVPSMPAWGLLILVALVALASATTLRARQRT